MEELQTKHRKEQRDLFVHGRFAPRDLDSEDSFVFTKAWGGRKAVVALNFTSRGTAVHLPQEGRAELLMSNYAGAEPADSLGPPCRSKLDTVVLDRFGIKVRWAAWSEKE